jgi:hypothetical protein
MQARLTAFAATAALFALGTVAVTAAQASRSASAEVSSPPPGLTTHGQVIWQLDALLRDTFGNKTVCVGPGYTQNFQLRCLPLSDYNEYFPTFVNARHSSWRLTRVHPNPAKIANVAMVRVSGLYVMCGRKEWLVSGASGVLPLVCINPVP